MTCDPEALRLLIGDALRRRVPFDRVVDYHPDGRPRTATISLDYATEIALDVLLAVGVDHVYLSTACLHDEHGECRRRCKFCNEPCACPHHIWVRVDELTEACD